MFVAIVVKTHL